jgi:hypothetical protein
MRLPNAEQAAVEREKIVDYLLNAAHPDNGGKAAFFTALGFKPDDWMAMAVAFRNLATVANVSEKLATAHGTKYIASGMLKSASGSSAKVRMVWIIDLGSDIPRLVTAYPERAKSHD